MPGFVLDVQGPEMLFNTPGGVINAVNPVSNPWVEGKTFIQLLKIAIQAWPLTGLATGMIV